MGGGGGGGGGGGWWCGGCGDRESLKYMSGKISIIAVDLYNWIIIMIMIIIIIIWVAQWLLVGTLDSRSSSLGSNHGRGTALCSWEKHFYYFYSVSLSWAQVYKCAVANLILHI